jgi:two-component system OmpR family sensor kinase
LLDLARLQDAGTQERVIVSWQDVVRSTVAERIALAEDRQIDLGVSAVADVKVWDSSEGLARLLGNAIDNALNHTPPGGRIDITLKAENGMAVLLVEDTGPGIPEADLDRVFEPFYRGESGEGSGNGISGETSGTGLGLSICKEIALRLGGTLTLANRSGEGLQFCYRQPVAAQTLSR